MEIETVGHAGLLVRDDDGAPILFTDPWITGSCYWRSWWLQNYPDDQLLQELRRVRYCYVTHEHPDHFHTASIRTLGQGIHYLSAEFLHGHVTPYLRGQGLKASILPAFEWTAVHPKVRVLSIPLANDDSVLLIDTPTAIVVNLNDSKPRRSQLQSLAADLERIAPGKRRVLLSSYSPASIVNSFLRGGSRVSLREKADYARAVSDTCRVLAADDFIPFASQVVFRRRDSTWANEFKVSFDDLQHHWTGAPTRLLPPYTRLDLATGVSSSVPPERYRHDAAAFQPKVEAQESLDATSEFSDAHVAKLQKKLAHARVPLALLFPRGIDFDLGHTHLYYSPWRGTLRRGRGHGNFTLRVPAQAFAEAVEYGHFGDLGTTMFTIVELNSGIHPRRVYLFFLLVTLHDYGHTTSLGNGLTWLRRSWRIQRWRIPAVPASPRTVEG